MNKKLINIVEKVVNQALLTEITCHDAYQRYYKDIDEQTYEYIVQKAQGNNNILLPDTKWILACYKRNPQYAKDAIDTVRLRDDRKTGVLDLFDRLKVRGDISGNDADLNRFKSIQELCDFIGDFNMHQILKRTQGEWSRDIKNAKNEITVFYEDDKWYVVIPETMEASCYWGSGTEWCTITRDEDNNLFYSYDDDGPLFILINKETGEKYQFHFESDSYMDKTDSRIPSPIFKSIGATHGLISAFRNYCEEMAYDFVDLIYEVVGRESRGLTCIKTNDGAYNFIDEENNIAFPEYRFYRPANFDFEWIIADCTNITNDTEIQDFMNSNGEFRFNNKFDFYEIGTPSHGLVYVYTQNGANYFDLDAGEFISKTWFKEGTDFSISRSVTYSTAIVTDENGKQNILKAIDGELISEDWFDSIEKIDTSRDITFMVTDTDEEENTIYNIIDFDGEYILPKWCYYLKTANQWGNIFICVLHPFGDSNHNIMLYDIDEEKVIEDNLENIDENFNNWWGLGAPTWKVKKNGKYNFLHPAIGYRLPKWADEVMFKPVWPLPKDTKISPEFMKIKVKDYKMPVLKYGDKWYCPTCADYRDGVELIEYKPEEVNENKLSKSDILYILKESAKLLTEISIKDAYSSYYKDIPEDIFTKIVSSSQSEPNILLPITKWVLQCYKRYPQGTMRGLNRLRQNNKLGLLDLYERLTMKKMLNGKETNISNYKTLDELRSLINQFDLDEILELTPGEWSKAVNDAKNNIRKFYEDDKWFCIIPEDMYASCYWGNGTRWCTATRNNENNMFDHYRDEGEIFILINKQTKEKYQFHFESEQFMDKEDNQIKTPVFQTIGASEGLMESFKRYCYEIDDIEGYYRLYYDIINGDDDRFCLKKQDGTYTYIDYEDEEVIFPEYTFLTCYPFEWDYLPAKFIYNGNTYINILDENKETLFEYNDISEIVDVNSRTCIVKSDKYNGYNMVDIATGEILFETWLKNIDSFGGKDIVTYKTGKQNIVLWGNEILFDKPVDMVVTNEDTHYILVCNKINGKSKWNVVGNSSLILDEWYDSVTIKTYPENKEKSYVSFAANLIIVKNEDEGAKLLKQHHDSIETLIEGVDEIGSFVECEHNVRGVFVKKDGKTNFFDINIKKLLDNWYDKMEVGRGYLNIPMLFAYMGDKRYIVGRSPDEREFRTVPYKDYLNAQQIK